MIIEVGKLKRKMKKKMNSEEEERKWVREREKNGSEFAVKRRLLFGTKWVILHWPRRHCQEREKSNRSGGLPIPPGRIQSASRVFGKLWRVSGKASELQMRWFLSLNSMELNYLRNPKVGIEKRCETQNGTIHGHAYRDKTTQINPVSFLTPN